MHKASSTLNIQFFISSPPFYCHPAVLSIYDKLPQAAKKIRQEVFGQEQGFKKEFDEIDPIAKHIILLEDDDPVATCRFYYSKEREC